jgi:hypothetical protein
MIDSLESLLHRCDAAEAKYDELLRLHQSLIHEVEVLKEQNEKLEGMLETTYQEYRQMDGEWLK